MWEGGKFVWVYLRWWGDVVGGLALIAIAFGDERALCSAVGSMLRRACPCVRCVVVSKTSASGAIKIVGRCRRSFGRHLQ